MSNLVRNDKFKNANEELHVPTSWGTVRVQIFGDRSENRKPIIALHGYLDNSNSFLPLSNFLVDHGYYIAAIDAPGHGLSSHLPNGIHYIQKIILTTMRRVVRYLELKKLIIIGHSFGSLCSLMYSTCYPDEVEALILLDSILGPEREKPLNEISQIWAKSIDTFLDFEAKKNLNSSGNNEKSNRVLTSEIAFEMLMKANKNLDETAAKILLERALKKKDDELEFSRDIRLKELGPHELFHYIDFLLMSKNFHENIKCSVLYVYASPPAYGDTYFNSTMDFFINLKNSKVTGNVEIVKIDGSHHFHMIQPEQTKSIIIDFLNSSLKN